MVLHIYSKMGPVAPETAALEPLEVPVETRAAAVEPVVAPVDESSSPSEAPGFVFLQGRCLYSCRRYHATTY